MVEILDGENLHFGSTVRVICNWFPPGSSGRKGKGPYQISNSELVHGTSLPKFKPPSYFVPMFRGLRHLLSCYIYNSIGWQQTCTLLSSQVIPFSSATTQTILMSFLACAVTLEVVCYLKTQARGWLLDLKNRGTESVGLLLGGRHVLLE